MEQGSVAMNVIESAAPPVFSAIPRPSPTTLALRDLTDGLRCWWLWNAMAWQDILLRYRGSMLGPFWLTLSMGIMITALGLLYSQLFKMELHDYLPFLCLGLLSWNMLSTMVIESCTVFTQSEAVIKQIKIPFMVHIYRMIWRNLIVAGHNAVVYPIVMIAFGVPATLATLLFLPGLALVIVNSVWIAAILGLICARFRDVPQIIANLVQVMFFVTPIIWKPELLGDNEKLAHLNPFFAFVDLLRAPLMGVAPTPVSWLVAILTTAVGGSIAFMLFARFRSRIAYWC
jgi:lipopolysaccharide transport system permease protein